MTHDTRMRKLTRVAGRLQRRSPECGSGRASRDGCGASRMNVGVIALRVMAAAQNARTRKWARFAGRLQRRLRECGSGCASRNGCGAAVSTPRGTLERWRLRRARGAAGYLPTQKSENTRSMTCSFMVSPVMSPRWARASRRSVAQRSSGRLDSIERMARSSACMA